MKKEFLKRTDEIIIYYYSETCQGMNGKVVDTIKKGKEEFFDYKYNGDMHSAEGTVEELLNRYNPKNLQGNTSLYQLHVYQNIYNALKEVKLS